MTTDYANGFIVGLLSATEDTAVKKYQVGDVVPEADMTLVGSTYTITG